jgi:hypothetical protein
MKLSDDSALTRAEERIRFLERRLEATQQECHALRVERDVAMKLASRWAAPRLERPQTS